MNIKSILSIASLLILSACGSDKSNKETSTSSTVTSIENKAENETIKTEPTLKLEEKTSETTTEAPPVETSVPKKQLEKAKAILASVDTETIQSIDAKRKYKMVCATCHGFKGNMNVNGAKDLTKSKISLEESVAQIYFGKGLMTASKGILEEAEIVAVAKYIEDFRK